MKCVVIFDRIYLSYIYMLTKSVKEWFIGESKRLWSILWSHSATGVESCGRGIFDVMHTYLTTFRGYHSYLYIPSSLMKTFISWSWYHSLVHPCLKRVTRSRTHGSFSVKSTRIAVQEKEKAGKETVHEMLRQWYESLMKTYLELRCHVKTCIKCDN
jgi:hypothetical protein